MTIARLRALLAAYQGRDSQLEWAVPYRASCRRPDPEVALRQRGATCWAVCSAWWSASQLLSANITPTSDSIQLIGPPPVSTRGRLSDGYATIVEQLEVLIVLDGCRS